MDLIWRCFEHVLEELPSRLSGSRVNELGDSELWRPVDTDEQIELPLAGLHLRDVDVEEADKVAFEPYRFC